MEQNKIQTKLPTLSPDKGTMFTPVFTYRTNNP